MKGLKLNIVVILCLLLLPPLTLTYAQPPPYPQTSTEVPPPPFPNLPTEDLIGKSAPPPPFKGLEKPPFKGLKPLDPDEVHSIAVLPTAPRRVICICKGKAKAITIGPRPSAVIRGLHLYILYKGAWVDTQAGIYQGQWTRLLLWNDRPQNLWLYEGYPDGSYRWYSLGYRWTGYYNAWFYADVVGWHVLAAWGDKSGWSNVVFIYIWPYPTWPPTPPCVTCPYLPIVPPPQPPVLSISVWVDKPYYRSGEPVTIHYYVNLDCIARLTITEPNLYRSYLRTLSPGTYIYTGIAGRPGVRKVIFEAWTDDGSYKVVTVTYTVLP